VNPGGGSGWDEPPIDIQIPDDARELDRDVLAYHREQRAKRRRNRLKRLAAPFGPVAARGTVMPLLASILAVCLVAGAMLSVATFSPATSPDGKTSPKATASATAPPPSTAPARASADSTAAGSTAAASSTAATRPAAASSPSGPRASHSASPSASAGRTHPSVRASVPGSPGAPR
jgi:cytoskeletal protein RodZ